MRHGTEKTKIDLHIQIREHDLEQDGHYQDGQVHLVVSYLV